MLPASGPPRGVYAPSAFPTVNAILYGAFVWRRGALGGPKTAVSGAEHAAHAVDPRTNTGSRRCLLLAYRKPSPSGLAQKPQAVPPVWAELGRVGRLPGVLTELLRPAFDSSITVGA